MIQYSLRRLFFSLLLVLSVGGLTMCGGNKAAEETDTSGKADTEAIILNMEEQRALRSEFSMEADKNINEKNFDKAFDELKKEIEADL